MPCNAMSTVNASAASAVLPPLVNSVMALSGYRRHDAASHCICVSAWNASRRRIRPAPDSGVTTMEKHLASRQRHSVPWGSMAARKPLPERNGLAERHVTTSRDHIAGRTATSRSCNASKTSASSAAYFSCSASSGRRLQFEVCHDLSRAMPSSRSQTIARL
jgi:hypothetical protein